MAKNRYKAAPGASDAAAPAEDLDVNKFENVHQVGGIQIVRLDDNPAPGSDDGVAAALFNTGSGLRFTVALDRGGDIVDAFFNHLSLAYLSPNGVKAPSHAYHRDGDWLYNWPGGLMTTCGPRHIGAPREEEGQKLSLHGFHSNTPAGVEMLINPDPHHGRKEMLLSMVTRDSRMFGPVIEVRRTIQCVLAEPEIRIYDRVTNRGNVSADHNWLYHVNLGYPLLDKGAKLIFAGTDAVTWQTPRDESKKTAKQLTAMKKIPDPLDEHAGNGERGVIVNIKRDRQGMAHVGLINPKLELGLVMNYPAEQLPRFANWQHFGPRGSYVTGIEPFTGSLMGKGNDDHPQVGQKLEPGDTRAYQLSFRVLQGKAELAELEKHDGDVKPRASKA